MREITATTGAIISADRHIHPVGPELAGRKIIKCPHCREMLMDVDRNTKVQLFRIPEDKRKPINCEKIKLCSICGGKVGYNLIPPTEV